MSAKKLCCLMLLGGASLNVNADTIFGVYAGAQGWDMSTSGGFADQQSISTFEFDSETNGSFYIAVEHPVPLIPNLKVSRTTLDTSGSTLINTSFSFGGELFVSNNTVSNQVDLTATDFILYYELFDNDLISFDLGINGKYVDGTALISDSQTNQIASQDFSGVIPMAYSRLAVGLPFTGLGAYAEGSYLSFDDSTVSDFQVALTYSFIESLALDLTLQVGYRDITVELDDLDNTFTDLSFDGPFAGIEFHF